MSIVQITSKMLEMQFNIQFYALNIICNAFYPLNMLNRVAVSAMLCVT